MSHAVRSGGFFPRILLFGEYHAWFCRGIAESVVVDPVILPDSGVGFQGPGYVHSIISVIAVVFHRHILMQY